MALSIPTGDGLIIFHYRLAGDSEDMLNIFGWEPPGDFVNGTGVAAANDLFTKWSTEMKSSVTPELTFVRCELLRKAGDGFIEWNSTATTVVGSSSGAALPPNVAALIHKSTDRGGRSGKGRAFLPGLSEGAVDSAGNISAAFITQINGDLDSAFTALASSVYVDELKLWHQESISNPTGDSITGLSIDPKVATQRRRLRR